MCSRYASTVIAFFCIPLRASIELSGRECFCSAHLARHRRKTVLLMPHFLNLLSVQPLRWVISEFAPAPTRLNFIQLTGRHMHAQPAVVMFDDESVTCAFFDAGKLVNLEQLHPTMKTLDLGDEGTLRRVPTIVERVPVPHIKRHEENIALLSGLVERRESLASIFGAIAGE